jgi:hypothetical protein
MIVERPLPQITILLCVSPDPGGKQPGQRLSSNWSSISQNNIAAQPARGNLITTVERRTAIEEALQASQADPALESGAI